MEKFKKTVLENGAVIVTAQLDNFYSVAMGITVKIGSRYETKQENGLAHFIEHMLFKGTKNRTAKDIAREIDGMGGMVNAATSKEYTYFYARVIAENAKPAWDLLQDILQNPLLDEKAIQVERGVIAQEIKAVEDSPEEQCFRNMLSLLYPEHPITYPVAGTRENILRFTRERLFSFREKYYNPDNIIISAAGKIEHDELVNWVKDSLNSNRKTPDKPSFEIPSIKEKIKVHTRKDLKQVHVALGCRTFKYKDKRRLPMLVLSNLFTGGMSSQLFQRLREELGIVYFVAGMPEFFVDTGLFAIYFATTPKYIKKCVSEIFNEMERLKKSKLNKKDLQNSKDNLKGGLILALEDTEHRMSRLAKLELYLGEYRTVDDVIKEIDKCQSEDILSLANELFIRERFVASLAGPVKEKDVKDIL